MKSKLINYWCKSLLMLFILSVAISCTTDQSQEAEKPNILYIMIDDLGWMDLRYQGNTDYYTPNIDRLAKQGMIFTDAYAAAPVCSPTRAAAMTGLSPARLQITNHIPDRWQFYNDK